VRIGQQNGYLGASGFAPGHIRNALPSIDSYTAGKIHTIFSHTAPKFFSSCNCHYEIKLANFFLKRN
jgi:hypothetical protein